MRRVDLANSVVLTASGITRLLDRLEAEGWVCKQHCKSDARVTWAVLTDAGHEKLLEAAQTHHADIARLFTDRLSGEELDALGVSARAAGVAAGGDRPRRARDRHLGRVRALEARASAALR